MSPADLTKILADPSLPARIHPTVSHVVGPSASSWSWLIVSHFTRVGLLLQKEVALENFVRLNTEDEVIERLRSIWELVLETCPAPEPTEVELKFIAEKYPDGVPWMTFEEVLAK